MVVTCLSLTVLTSVQVPSDSSGIVTMRFACTGSRQTNVNLAMTIKLVGSQEHYDDSDEQGSSVCDEDDLQGEDERGYESESQVRAL